MSIDLDPRKFLIHFVGEGEMVPLHILHSCGWSNTKN